MNVEKSTRQQSYMKNKANSKQYMQHDLDFSPKIETGIRNYIERC